MITRDQVLELADTTVYDSSGEKLGKVGQVYLDRANNQPSWVTVQTGLLGMKESFVPLQRAETREDRLQVAVKKQEVKDAPKIDADGELTPDREAELYDYYQLSPEGGSPGTYGRSSAEQRAASDGAGDQAMTRSEERMRVSAEQTEQGQARLRKSVVTEHVQQTVPVRHEEVRLEREPITEANRRSAMSGPEISEAEYETTLHAERPVIVTETVPVEQVRLSKETVTEQRNVEGEVRKEKIDFDRPGQDSKQN
ncbi:MAG: DUF2382 domain-containing protein, partial [Terriglobales bacterium]